MQPHPDVPTGAALAGALSRQRQLDVVVGRAARIGNLVATAPGAPVPSCPDWSAATLARHVRKVLAFVTAALESPPHAMPERPELDRPDDAAAGRALLDQATHTADVLRDTPPDRPVWTWWGEGHAAFWLRRMVHETTIHAVDAELAAGQVPGRVDAAVAADGVDELLTTHTVLRPGQPGFTANDGDDLHVHLTDADDAGPAPAEWLVTCTLDGAVTQHEHATARVALRGDAHDVLLSLWRRQPIHRLERLGEEDDVVRWERRLAGLVL